MQGILIVIPLAAIYVASVVVALSLGVESLLIISGVILVSDIILFFEHEDIFKRRDTY